MTCVVMTHSLSQHTRTAPLSTVVLFTIKINMLLISYHYISIKFVSSLNTQARLEAQKLLYFYFLVKYTKFYRITNYLKSKATGNWC